MPWVAEVAYKYSNFLKIIPMTVMTLMTLFSRAVAHQIRQEERHFDGSLLYWFDQENDSNDSNDTFFKSSLTLNSVGGMWCRQTSLSEIKKMTVMTE